MPARWNGIPRYEGRALVTEPGDTKNVVSPLRLSNWKLKLKEADLITGQEFFSELVIALKTILFLPDSHRILLSFTVRQQHKKTLWL